MRSDLQNGLREEKTASREEGGLLSKAQRQFARGNCREKEREKFVSITSLKNEEGNRTMKANFYGRKFDRVQGAPQRWASHQRQMHKNASKENWEETGPLTLERRKKKNETRMSREGVSASKRLEPARTASKARTREFPIQRNGDDWTQPRKTGGGAVQRGTTDSKSEAKGGDLRRKAQADGKSSCTEWG